VLVDNGIEDEELAIVSRGRELGGFLLRGL